MSAENTPTPEQEHYCARCGERLNPARMVWLELDQRTNTYHDDGGVPESRSQGWFAFGSACARRQRAEHAATKEPTQ